MIQNHPPVHNDSINYFNVARVSKPCLETSPATFRVPGLRRTTSPEPRKHVARRRQRLCGLPWAKSRRRQRPKPMSRDVAGDVAGAPWRCRQRPTPMSRDVARDIWQVACNIAKGSNPCRATSPETSPEHLGDVATGRHPCRETSPETFRATPPFTLGLFAKLLNEFVLGGAISY